MPTKRLPSRLAFALATLFSLSACSAPPAGWQLPDAISEVSGLASDAEGRLYLHDDEVGLVYRLDTQTGDVQQLFSIGRPSLKADFEGIALLASDVWLITSQGQLHQIVEGLAPGNPIVDSRIVATGLKDICEVEGLATLAATLVIACKTNYRDEDKGSLLLYQYQPDSQQTQLLLRMDLQQLGIKKFSPSAVLATTDKFYLLAARQHRLLVINHQGELLANHKLDKRTHRQAEGLAMTRAGLFIADEGKQQGGTITHYPELNGISRQ